MVKRLLTWGGLSVIALSALLFIPSSSKADVYWGLGGRGVYYGTAPYGWYGSPYYGGWYGSGWYGSPYVYNSGYYGNPYVYDSGYYYGGRRGLFGRRAARTYTYYDTGAPLVYGDAYGGDIVYGDTGCNGGFADQANYGNFAPNRDSVRLTVDVPENAKLWIEGARMRQTGEEREFVSPPIQPGKDFIYHLKARWKDDNGEMVTREKRVRVHAGQRLTIDMTKEGDNEEMEGTDEESEENAAPQRSNGNIESSVPDRNADQSALPDNRSKNDRGTDQEKAPPAPPEPKNKPYQK